MFSECSNLKELDLENFDTTKVTDMTHMFYECRSLKNLDWVIILILKML